MASNPKTEFLLLSQMPLPKKSDSSNRLERHQPVYPTRVTHFPLLFLASDDNLLSNRVLPPINHPFLFSSHPHFLFTWRLEIFFENLFVCFLDTFVNVFKSIIFIIKKYYSRIDSWNFTPDETSAGN